MEDRKAARNVTSQEVARRKRAGEPADDLIAEGRAIGQEVAAQEATLAEVEAELGRILLELPNVTLPEVPEGGEEQNVVVRQWGEPRDAAGVRPHWEIGAALGLFDPERASKISGSGFIVYRGMGARLVRSLLSFFLDVHGREHGYEEVWAPALVNRASMTGTGQLPKFEDDAYAVSGDDLFLIPTAEVPVTNLYRDEMLDAAQLPMAFTAYTPCFRREAGSAGKDTRGLLRMHQFDKVELVRYAEPEHSRDELGAPHRPRRVDPAAPRHTVPGEAARGRRHGFLERDDLRPRGVGARRRHLAGSLVVQHLHRLPGAAREHPLPPGAR